MGHVVRMDPGKSYHTDFSQREQEGSRVSGQNGAGSIRYRPMLTAEAEDALAESEIHQSLAISGMDLIVRHGESSSYSHKTISKYTSVFGRFLGWCSKNNLQLERLDHEQIALFFTESSFKRETQRAYLHGIELGFRLLLKEKLIKCNPAEHYRLPSLKATKAVAALTPCEVQRVLDAIGDDDRGIRDRAVIELTWAIAATAQSASEICFENLTYLENDVISICVPTAKGQQTHFQLSESECLNIRDYIARLNRRVPGHNSTQSWGQDPKAHLFRSIQNTTRKLSRQSMSSSDLASAVQRRLKQEGCSEHSIRSIRRGRIRQWINLAKSVEDLEIIRVATGLHSVSALFRYAELELDCSPKSTFITSRNDGLRYR